MRFYLLRDGDTAPYVLINSRDIDQFQAFRSLDAVIDHMLANPGDEYQTAAFAELGKVYIPPPPLAPYERPPAGQGDHRSWTVIEEQGPPTPLMPVALLSKYRPLPQPDLVKISERTAHFYKPAKTA